VTTIPTRYRIAALVLTMLLATATAIGASTTPFVIHPAYAAFGNTGNFNNTPS
jgi:hypothetical protein